MGVRTPETCWAVNKRQVNKLEKFLHLVGDLFELSNISFPVNHNRNWEASTGPGIFPGTRPYFKYVAKWKAIEDKIPPSSLSSPTHQKRSDLLHLTAPKSQLFPFLPKKLLLKTFRLGVLNVNVLKITLV
jgi:hypothetical protein